MWYVNKIVSGLGTLLETSSNKDKNTDLSKVPGPTVITLTPSQLKTEDYFHIGGNQY